MANITIARSMQAPATGTAMYRGLMPRGSLVFPSDRGPITGISTLLGSADVEASSGCDPETARF